LRTVPHGSAFPVPSGGGRAAAAARFHRETGDGLEPAAFRKQPERKGKSLTTSHRRPGGGRDRLPRQAVPVVQQLARQGEQGHVSPRAVPTVGGPRTGAASRKA